MYTNSYSGPRLTGPSYNNYRQIIYCVTRKSKKPFKTAALANQSGKRLVATNTRL